MKDLEGPSRKFLASVSKAALNLFFLVWVSALAYGGAAPTLNHEIGRLSAKNPALPRKGLPQIWFLQWHMFRYYSPAHREAYFEGRRGGGEWIRINPREFFRYRYDSGLRFDRPDVWANPLHQDRLLNYLCKRYNDRHPEAPLGRIRLICHIWPKRPGSFHQEPRSPQEVKERILRERKCFAG